MSSRLPEYDFKPIFNAKDLTGFQEEGRKAYLTGTSCPYSKKRDPTQHEWWWTGYNLTADMMSQAACNVEPEPDLIFNCPHCGGELTIGKK